MEKCYSIYQWGFKPFRKHAKPNPISVGQWLIQNVTRIFLYFLRIVCLYHKVTLNKKNQWNWNCCFSPMKLHAWWIRLRMHPLIQSQQSTKNDCHNLPIPFGIRFFKNWISNLRIILKKTSVTEAQYPILVYSSINLFASEQFFSTQQNKKRYLIFEYRIDKI